MATLNELRTLAALLPPNERVLASESADLVSALVALGHYGDDLLAAAKEGANAVADFFHQHITDNRPEGADEPVKGLPPVAAAPTPAAGVAAPGLSPADNAAMQQILGALQGISDRITALENRSAAAPTETSVTDTTAHEGRPTTEYTAAHEGGPTTEVTGV